MKATTTLTKAAELVGGDRNKEHGDIAVGFNKTAKLWSTYLNTTISAEQVAVMLTLLKISRTTSGKKAEDHYLDMAGYAAIAGELAASPDVYRLTLDRSSYGEAAIIEAKTYTVNTPSGTKEIVNNVSTAKAVHPAAIPGDYIV